MEAGRGDWKGDAYFETKKRYTLKDFSVFFFIAWNTGNCIDIDICGRGGLFFSKILGN